MNYNLNFRLEKTLAIDTRGNPDTVTTSLSEKYNSLVVNIKNENYLRLQSSIFPEVRVKNDRTFRDRYAASITVRGYLPGYNIETATGTYPETYAR